MTNNMTKKRAHEVAPEDNGAIDFGLDRLDVSQKTARFDMPQVAPGAYLILRPASDANPQYQAGMLRMSGKRNRKIATSGEISDADAAKDRDDDRSLYARFVIVGWGGITTKDGEDVEFTPASCKQFLKQLPNWLFDRVRLFAMRPERFLDEDEAEEPSAVELAGN
jgi:hypothetical protein